jgi:ribosomal protein L37AE/L43A
MSFNIPPASFNEGRQYAPSQQNSLLQYLNQGCSNNGFNPVDYSALRCHMPQGMQEVPPSVNELVLTLQKEFEIGQQRQLYSQPAIPSFQSEETNKYAPPTASHLPKSENALHTTVDAHKVCGNCGTSDTPLWRREGRLNMCNACGIYFKIHGYHRPVELILAAHGHSHHVQGSRRESLGDHESAHTHEFWSIRYYFRMVKWYVFSRSSLFKL